MKLKAVKLLVICLCLTNLFVLAFVASAQSADTLRTITWNTESTLFAVGGTIDGLPLMQIYNTDGQFVQQIQVSSNVLSLSWSADSGMIAATTLSELGTAYEIWNVTTGALVSTFQQEGETLNYSAYWSPNQLQITTVGGYTIYVRDVVTGVAIATLSEVASNTDAIEDIAWSFDGTQIYAISGDNVFRIWDVNTSSIVQRTSFPTRMYTLVLNQDGSMIALAGNGELGYIVDAITGTILDTFQIGPNFGIKFIYWYPNGTQIATASIRNDIRVSDLQTDLSINITNNVNQILEDIDFSTYGGRYASITRPYPSGDASINTQVENSIQSLFNGAVQIVVPDPSLERLQSIAALCNAPVSLTDALASPLAETNAAAILDANLAALAEGAIPPGCEADLRAVAEALQATQ